MNWVAAESKGDTFSNPGIFIIRTHRLPRDFLKDYSLAQIPATSYTFPPGLEIRRGPEQCSEFSVPREMVLVCPNGNMERVSLRKGEAKKDTFEDLGKTKVRAGGSITRQDPQDRRN